MNKSTLAQTEPLSITYESKGLTYNVNGKEFPVIGFVKTNGQSVPIVDIPSMSDYKWQLMCLQDRLKHPEKYQDTEDVEATIERLKKWLAEHATQATGIAG